jgi:hypothetical protein
MRTSSPVRDGQPRGGSRSARFAEVGEARQAQPHPHVAPMNPYAGGYDLCLEVSVDVLSAFVGAALGGQELFVPVRPPA